MENQDVIGEERVLSYAVHYEGVTIAERNASTTIIDSVEFIRGAGRAVETQRGCFRCVVQVQISECIHARVTPVRISVQQKRHDPRLLRNSCLF